MASLPTVTLNNLSDDLYTFEERAIIRGNLMSLQRYVTELRNYYSWVLRNALKLAKIDHVCARKLFDDFKKLARDVNTSITSVISKLKKMDNLAKKFVKSHHKLPCVYRSMFIGVLLKRMSIVDILSILPNNDSFDSPDDGELTGLLSIELKKRRKAME